MILKNARIRNGLRVYAIGDVHGCIKELRQLMAMIDAEQSSDKTLAYKIIFLGDYIDRGPDNFKVIDYLIKLRKSERDVTFLRGNHDERPLLFLKHPKRIGKDFLKWGGDATLRDYKVDVKSLASFEEMATVFAQNLPKSHKSFLKNLETSTIVDDYFFCHAGVRPGISLAEQKDHDLSWIRTDFIHHDAPFEKVIVHGHTIVDRPEVKPNRINVDTCCYGTGHLTALVLEGKYHRFLHT